MPLTSLYLTGRPDEDSDKGVIRLSNNQVPGASCGTDGGIAFDQAILQKLRDKGCNIEFVTLQC